MNFEEEYDSLYEKIDEFIKRVNPCQISNGTCYRGRKGHDNFCCGKTPTNPVCKYCNNGCIANKPLYCRIWICDEAFENLNPKDKKECIYWESKVANFLNKYNLDGFRKSKDDLFDKLGLLKMEN